MLATFYYNWVPAIQLPQPCMLKSDSSSGIMWGCTLWGDAYQRRLLLLRLSRQKGKDPSKISLRVYKRSKINSGYTKGARSVEGMQKEDGQGRIQARAIEGTQQKDGQQNCELELVREGDLLQGVQKGSEIRV